MRAWAAAMGIALAGAPALCAPPAPPRLIVVLSIDQFSDELYQRYRASFTGGLKRLGAGISFTGYQSHALTETCPGHSTILSGRHPNATGIIANNWFDAAHGGAKVYCVDVPGAADPDARGPQNLRVTTFGDWLKQARPGARVVSISGKDRAAIMLAGHHADAVYWWKDDAGFTTSPYAGPATRTVTAPAKFFNKKLFARWRHDPPALWPAAAPPACASLQKPHRFGVRQVSGTIPPETANNDFADRLRVSPSFDPIVLNFATRTIDRLRLGHGPQTDLLAISLSATDHVGHRYGNGGAETCVQMASLDHALGQLLSRLDALHVHYVVALTADHGAIDATERAVERGMNAHRIDPDAFRKALNQAVKSQLGLSFNPLKGDIEQPTLVDDGDASTRTRIRDAALAWLRQQPEVVAAFTAEEVAAAAPAAGKSPDRLSVVERFHESYDKERSGDIMVQYSQFATLGMPRDSKDSVGGHGSAWDYDRRVPILFWWPGIAPDARSEPVETVDIAPTLGAIARVPTPPVDGKCLSSVAPDCP